jgi:hypothetical protein
MAKGLNYERRMRLASRFSKPAPKPIPEPVPKAMSYNRFGVPKEDKEVDIPTKIFGEVATGFLLPSPSMIKQAVQDPSGTIRGGAELVTLGNPVANTMRAINLLQGDGFSLYGADMSDVEQFAELASLIPGGKAVSVPLKAATKVVTNPMVRGGIISGAKAIGPSLGRGLTSGGFGELFEGVSEAASAGARRASAARTTEPLVGAIETPKATTARAVPTPAGLEDWEKGFDPLNLDVDGRTGEMSRETYEIAQRHFGERNFPQAEIFDDVARLPKGKNMAKTVRELLKQLPGHLVTPVSAKQIDKTSKGAVPRINSQYVKDAEASDILSTYKITRVDPDIPRVTEDAVLKMRSTFESDYGQAYRYDPVTGEYRITNNEHVFSVSTEALRHNFEVRQLEASIRTRGLSYKQGQKEMQDLIDQQKIEMEVALDPNQSMLILSDKANQRIVGALPARDKIEALREQDVGGVRGTYEDDVYVPNLPDNTFNAYQEIIENAKVNAPRLVESSLDDFRADYAKLIKPLRNKLQYVKDPKIKAEIEKQIKEQEELLYQTYYT